MKNSENKIRNISWENLEVEFEKKLEVTENDTTTDKNLKRVIKASYKSARREAFILLACTLVFIVLSLALTFARNTNSVVYSIVRVVVLVMFLIMLIFAIVLSCRAKAESKSSKAAGMNEIIRERKKQYWLQSLDELAEKNKLSGKYVFMDILATTEVKSVYFKLIKLVELLLFVGELCFLPGLGDILMPNVGISEAMEFVFSLLYVVMANLVANYIGSKMDELTTINYRYSEMKRLVLEEYCKDR